MDSIGSSTQLLNKVVEMGCHIHLEQEIISEKLPKDAFLSTISVKQNI
jgi:hypothetical protein